MPRKGRLSITALIAQLLGPLPQPLRRTITIDNGTEFAQHLDLHRTLALQTFFCDPYSPWQKGGVENAIGRMRRILPRKTDLAAVSKNQLDRILLAYNNTPRKCLDWLAQPRPSVPICCTCPDPPSWRSAAASGSAARGLAK